MPKQCSWPLVRRVGSIHHSCSNSYCREGTPIDRCSRFHPRPGCSRNGCRSGPSWRKSDTLSQTRPRKCHPVLFWCPAGTPGACRACSGLVGRACACVSGSGATRWWWRRVPRGRGFGRAWWREFADGFFGGYVSSLQLLIPPCLFRLCVFFSLSLVDRGGGGCQ